MHPDSREPPWREARCGWNVEFQTDWSHELFWPLYLPLCSVEDGLIVRCHWGFLCTDTAPPPSPPQGLMAVLHRMFIVIGASNDALRSYVLRWGLAVLSWQNSCLMTQQLIWLQTLPLWNCWNIPPNLNKEVKSQNIEARIRVNTLQWNHVVVFCAGRVIVCAIIIHSLSLLPNFRMFGKCLGQLRTCSLCCLACVNAFCLSAYVNNPPSYLETVLHSVSMVLLEMWGPLMPNLSSTLLLCLARLNF